MAISNLQKKVCVKEDLTSLVTHFLDENKAENIVILDLREKTNITDKLIIASGLSQRHLAALSDKLLELFKKLNIKSPHVEGYPNHDWILVDIGDMIIHLFRPEIRDFYNLEKMWGSHFTEHISEERPRE